MIRSALMALLIGAVCTSQLQADAFDDYTNAVLTKVPGADGVLELKQLTPALVAEYDRVLPGVAGAFLVVKTNDGRFSKLLVQAARQKVSASESVPILLIDRFTTYREGQERAVQVSGQNVCLFSAFLYNLDIGQVVPASVGGDLRFVVEGGKFRVEPIGKARLYVLTKALPAAAPKKSEKLVIGQTFLPRYFNGTYKLHDDGRRSGTLTLQVAEDGEVTGAYYSDKDGQKYEVDGKIGTSKHTIQFTIKFPRVRQDFQGWLFTGDGAALVGSSRLLERETGFYALRTEEK